MSVNSMTENDIYKTLQCTDSYMANYMKILMDAGVPYTPIQYNIMFTHRQYGKTFMAFGLLMAEAIETLKYNDTYINTIGAFDPDGAPVMAMQRYWIKGLKKYISDYFPKYEVTRNGEQIIITLKKV